MQKEEYYKIIINYAIQKNTAEILIWQPHRKNNSHEQKQGRQTSQQQLLILATGAKVRQHWKLSETHSSQMKHTVSSDRTVNEFYLLSLFWIGDGPKAQLA